MQPRHKLLAMLICGKGSVHTMPVLHRLLPITVIHPVVYERKLEQLFGARIATQLYCPPARGIMEAISAMTKTWQKTPNITKGYAAIAPVGPPFINGGSRLATEPSQVSTAVSSVCFSEVSGI